MGAGVLPRLAIAEQRIEESGYALKADENAAEPRAKKVHQSDSVMKDKPSHRAGR